MPVAATRLFNIPARKVPQRNPGAAMSSSGNAPFATDRPLQRGWFKRTVTRPAQPDRTPDPMQELILLQTAGGWWSLTPELAEIFGRTLPQLEAAIQAGSDPREEVRRAWATALALEWLEANGADRRDEWRLLAKKARKWLEDATARPPDGGTWHDAARQFLGLAPSG
jgi:hypothetical protein